MADQQEKDVGGRPTKYNGAETDELAYRLALLGLIDTEIASVLGVCEKTINNWKHEHPTFLQSLQKGKLVADADAALSLYKRVKGYQFQETRTEIDANGKVVKEISTIKELPPDPASCFIWLKNRQPKKWKDKRETESTVKHDLVDMKERQSILEQKTKEAKKRLGIEDERENEDSEQ